MQFDISAIRLAIVGLGYVGLPLAAAFGSKFATLGYDTNQQRIKELQHHFDANNDYSAAELEQASMLTMSSDSEDLKACNVFIVTVPTPIDANRNPDFQPLISASQTISKYLKANDLVIYESTVYPGAIEEVCVPILASGSGLKFNQDFFVGYSPERINPGDKNKRLKDIIKITAGSTPQIAEFVDQLYKQIITAGTHKVSSIAVAEAAKVIENTQRDLNIALINELAIIFNKLKLDTEEILNAAATKWNFMRFSPGLVGGHCIGVDPYYLTHKAEAIGYHPEVILAGRRINDNMGKYVVSQIVKIMLQRKIHVADARVLILGITFKENCPDVRNSRVIDMVRELQDYGAVVEVFDPIADPKKVQHEYNLSLLTNLPENAYDAIVLAVPHAEFKEMHATDLRRFGKEIHVLYDVKHMLPRAATDGRL
jgi:UDP-N-acetyl-D-glucosamine/UDP-N-acetyl-D-galactosamine dehydrogenase